MILRDCWLLFLDIETLCIAVSKIKIADMVMVFLIKMLARSVCWSSDYHMTVPSANSWVLNWWLNVCIFKYVDSNVKWQLYWYWMLFYLHAVKGNNIFISVLKIYVKWRELHISGKPVFSSPIGWLSWISCLQNCQDKGQDIPTFSFKKLVGVFILIYFVYNVNVIVEISIHNGYWPI